MKSSLGALQAIYRTLPVTFVTSRLSVVCALIPRSVASSSSTSYSSNQRQLANFNLWVLQLSARVNSYKILGVHVSNDLTWNTHIDYLIKKTNKRLYALRILKKSGLAIDDLVKIFCALIRSILEYASPVWAALPEYLDNVIESVQRKALCIMLPDLRYGEALHRTS